MLGTFEAVHDPVLRATSPATLEELFELLERRHRLVMCAELTAVDQAGIVIPIVFRNEYQTALRNLARDGRCDLYVRTLAYAWRWTAALPWRDRAAVDGQLVATNALTDSIDAEREGARLELP